MSEGLTQHSRRMLEYRIPVFIMCATGPGSHQLLYRGLSDEVNFVPNENYTHMLEQAKTQIAPVEFLGGVGDVHAPLNVASECIFPPQVYIVFALIRIARVRCSLRTRCLCIRVVSTRATR